ncbi:Mpo1 family 2-hydroxy fatty acid dioxygenase [Caballeronia ptereochthonis]|uniref:PF06127 family protein n=1 Tax=Caballeronia ptereochthonis TaxID=1777144 RepID=A0A158D759_9BURK|nr:Mpo1-like protein [Caballeronia ptereochthonis]SAK90439.1 PF06127 family protein [Caballeronia ptereochthonis]
MRTLTDHLSQYAEYHRDKRNVATHFIGIPLIVLAIAALLGRPAWPIFSGAFMLTPAWLLFALATLYYLWLDVPLGIGMGIVSALSAAFGDWAASQATSIWLTIGIGMFVIGWIFQFIGHVRYEHRKPAFVDDIIGLLIGPLFILVELLSGLGLRRDLHDAIQARAAR